MVSSHLGQGNEMSGLPDGFSSEFLQCGDIQLHVVHNRRVNDQRPALVFLHGFPEFWIAWRDVFIEFADSHLIIAPDQRGFNRSDAPDGVEHYHTRNMVQDLFLLADHLIGEKTFVLLGHDWGASVAYAAAIARPDRISKLVIANGVHPVCFQEALIDDLAQRNASQYFHILTAPRAAEKMAEDDFRRTFSMFEKFSATPWLTPDIRAEYLEAWSRPGRLQAMLNWYAGSPIVVPRPDERLPEAPLYGGQATKFAVPMPHLLIWGDGDPALLSSATKRLEEFAPKLERNSLKKADHWLLHTHAAEIAERIRDFL